MVNPASDFACHFSKSNLVRRRVIQPGDRTARTSVTAKGAALATYRSDRPISEFKVLKKKFAFAGAADGRAGEASSATCQQTAKRRLLRKLISTSGPTAVIIQLFYCLHALRCGTDSTDLLLYFAHRRRRRLFVCLRFLHRLVADSKVYIYVDIDSTAAVSSRILSRVVMNFLLSFGLLIIVLSKSRFQKI